MKRKSLIAAVMVLVLLCASSVCTALAYFQCDHNVEHDVIERFSTVSEETCDKGTSSCTVTVTYTMYDIECPKCFELLGYAEQYEYDHSGTLCGDSKDYDEYYD